MKRYKVKLYSNFTGKTTEDFINVKDDEGEDEAIKRVSNWYNMNIISIIGVEECR